MTSLDPKFWCYIIRRFVSLGGQSRSSRAAGIAARLFLKMSLCVRSLSTSRTYTFAKECTASIITSAHYISNFCILLSSYYNKPTYSTPKELWSESCMSSTSLNQHPSGNSRSVNTGVPDLDHLTQDTTYSTDWLVFVTETESVYCAVRTGHLTIMQANISS